MNSTVRNDRIGTYEFFKKRHRYATIITITRYNAKLVVSIVARRIIISLLSLGICSFCP